MNEQDEDDGSVDLVQGHSGHWTVFSAGVSMEEQFRKLSDAQEWCSAEGYTVDNIRCRAIKVR